jgi:hypothetical protein
VGQQQGRVGRLDVLVYVGRGLLDDQRPEVGDARDDLVALFVEGLVELDLLADWGGWGLLMGAVPR